jgi:hypothetical protein
MNSNWVNSNLKHWFLPLKWLPFATSIAVLLAWQAVSADAVLALRAMPPQAWTAFGRQGWALWS